MALALPSFRLCFLVFIVLHFANSYGSFEGSKQLETKEILLNYGAAHDSFSLLFVPDTSEEGVISAEVLDYDESILTDVEIRTTLVGSEVHKGATNVTCELSFDGKVGVTEYRIVIKTVDKTNLARKSYTVKGKYSVVGLVLYTGDGQIASGERSTGLKFSSYEEVLSEGPKALKVVLQEPMNMSSNFDFSKIKIHVNPFKGNQQMGVVDLSSFSMNGDKMKVLPKPYRVSSTPQMVTLVYPDFQIGGEVFETILMVSVPNTKSPPPVVTGPGGINLTQGIEAEFGVAFFNLMSPPQRKIVKRVIVLGESKESEFVVSSRPYEQTKNAGGLEERIMFKSEALNFTGTYEVKMVAVFEDGSSMPCHMEKDIYLSIKRSANVVGQAGGDNSAKAPSKLSGRAISLPLIILAGVAGVAVVLTVILALVRYHRNREAEVMESSFSKSGPLGVPGEYGALGGGEFVLRDAYARTGSSHSEIPAPAGEDPESEMRRTQSQASSHVSF